MIVVTGRVETTAEQRDALRATAAAMCSASRRDTGCISYGLFVDDENPDRFVFIEEWEDEEALQSHFRQPHTATFMGEIAGLVTATDARFFTVERARRLGPGGLVDV